VVLGKGDVNIKAVMKAAKKAGVKHYFIEDESTRVMAQLPLSLQYLRSLR
jgi:sugar phosphate isomerase/epimerase